MPTISHLLNITVAVQREQNIRNAQGGFSNEVVTVSGLEAVPSRRSPASGRDRFVAGREEADVTHAFYFEPGVDVRTKDFLLVGVSSKYEVLRLLPPSEEAHLKALTQEIQNA